MASRRGSLERDQQAIESDRRADSLSVSPTTRDLLLGAELVAARREPVFRVVRESALHRGVELVVDSEPVEDLAQQVFDLAAIIGRAAAE
jgi:hypothetical protein